MAEKRNERDYMGAWLGEMGYRPDTRMAEQVDAWWGWLVGVNGFYHYQQQRGFRLVSMERLTMHPAALVAEAWSDLLMTERTSISSEDSAMQALLDERFVGFALDNADMVARSFALGTGAWALSFSNVGNSGQASPDARIEILDYDATQIMPLTYSARSCAQCAFASRVEVGGRDYDQCQAHVVIGGTYHILTQLFDAREHRPVSVEGILSDFDTGSEQPTFALVRPAVPNKSFNYCAMGASVYEKAIDTIKLVDEAFTSFHRHLRVGSPKLFVSDELIEKNTSTDPATGKKFTRYSAFGEADDMVFRMRPGGEGSGAKAMEAVQPALKVDENAAAVNDALKMLSLECGFGNGYFSWDAHQGLRTATEVVSDNSSLARSLRRHQNALRASIVALVRGMAGACRGVMGVSVDPGAPISVDFDDSVIVDTETEKRMDLAEIAALNLPELKRAYLVRWKGFSPEEAAEAVPKGAAMVDAGF